MQLSKLIQDAWNTQARWLRVLRPLSWLYAALFWLNQKSYQLGLKKTYTAPVPVMVIGNITVGGSGKTPLLIQLVKHLQQHQVKVGVISRGYGGQGPFPVLVNHLSQVKQCGDEPLLIVQSTQVPMAVAPNRQSAIELLLKNHTLDLIISDDGLQHFALARQIEWVVLDMQRGLGNKKMLPEGFLREPVARLEQATVIEHAYDSSWPLNMQLRPGQPYLMSGDSLSAFDPNAGFHVVVGIGFPKRFYNTLESLNIHMHQQHEFADHHDYILDDIVFNDALPIITTEKDAVKLKPLLSRHPDLQLEVWVLPVEALLSKSCYEVLHQELSQQAIHIEPL